MAERLADHEETSSTPTAGAVRLKTVQEAGPILTIIWPILNYSALRVPCASSRALPTWRPRFTGRLSG